MKLNKLSPIIWTQNIQETVTFYKKLGFKALEENDDLIWTCLRNGDIEINVALPVASSEFKQPQFTGSFYFNVDEVDQLWDELKSDHKIVYELETFDWGMREFAIYDNNGYILQFGQSIEFEFDDE